MSESGSHGKHSTFVTVVAWVFIVIFSFLTLTALLLNIMVFSFMEDMKKLDVGNKTVQKEPEPDGLQFFRNNFNSLFITGPPFFVVSVIMLLSAIGLLNRLNIARILFMSMLIMIITAILFLFMYKLLFSFGVSSVSQGSPQTLYSNFSGWLQSMTVLINVFTVIIPTGIMVVFVFIIKNLLSKDVILEFHPFLREKETGGGEITRVM
ncbi:MAG: hypothetical protein JW881_08915 [Spirochaetales bacterium]|nr:hypothetical protein [Spirochaetales bacterium]